MNNANKTINQVFLPNLDFKSDIPLITASANEENGYKTTITRDNPTPYLTLTLS